jgi:hypothetical protein
VRKSCRICGSPLSAQIVERIQAANAPLKVTALGMPVARCARGHAFPVDDDFMLWLMHELKEREGSFDAGEEKGMLFKKYLCACGTELAAKPERTRAFVLDLAYDEAPPFKVELEMPVYKCAGCGKEQLHSHKAIRGPTSFAIARLNDAAGFPHSG